MQQTTPYKFNLIETSDTFGPAPLNDNAQNMEDQLTALAVTEAANKAALEQAMAAQKSELQAADAALQAAMGIGGKTCRIAWGSYVGTGKSITVDFRPLIVFFSYQGSPQRSHVMIRGSAFSLTSSSSTYNVTWGDRSVSWEDNYSVQNGATVNHYVVIGEYA